MREMLCRPFDAFHDSDHVVEATVVVFAAWRFHRRRGRSFFVSGFFGAR